YQGTKQKAQECLSINPELGTCWWQLARAETSLGNAELGSAALQTAEAKGYGVKTEQAYLHLANAYLAAKDYENMAAVYNELINHDYGPNNAQYHASFAAVNRILGRNEEARRGTLAVLLLNPAAKEDVAAFFSTLPDCGSESSADQTECYTISALLRLYLKEPKAEQELRKALARGILLRIELRSWVTDAAKYYVAADPTNADFHLASAIILQSFGSSREQAKAEALKAQELDPNKKDIVDLFIKNL
ncbi:MAG: hypothetical protein HYV55_02115, partial [Parcubacteria group bacterium]|nr:hypothetical protein [Parcubacteria group bacterium]